jgi:hypothetical protein
MKRSGLAILLLLVLGSIALNRKSIAPPQMPPLPAVSPKYLPIILFDGKSLSGFYTWLVDTKKEDPRGVFSVKDGMIRISGDGFGYLATEHRYYNYELIAEFKWGEKNFRGREKKARDSGIFLHANGTDGNSFDGNGAYKAAIECQIMEGAVGDLLKIRGTWRVQGDGFRREVMLRPEWIANVSDEVDDDGYHWWKEGGNALWNSDEAGRMNWKLKDARWKDELSFRGKQDVESALGEWTRVRCICREKTIVVFVNDQKVNQVQQLNVQAGQILLQCEGSEIYFRRLELRPLPKIEEVK